MVTPRKILLDTLDDLGAEDFEKFKWLLQDKTLLKGFKLIRLCQLENANRIDTLNQLLKTYSLYTVRVIRIILVAINRNDLEQELSKLSFDGWHWENSLNTEVQSGLG
uniref:Pyrin domain-containing protein n=1 Tax=Sphaeramia orbicularis TaxID=375764 RepID=A0A673CAF2_9TELE